MTQIVAPVVIRGTGSFVPEGTMTNEDFAAYLDTNDEWITQRTGIKTRHRVGKGETTVTLAAAAARRALEDAKLSPRDIDLIIVCTATPEMPVPSTACILQRELGMEGVPAFDVSAACSGLMYGMNIAANMILGGGHRNVLLVGAELLTKYSDYEDRATCILFGDGAGAMILSPSPTPDRGFLYRTTGADGTYWDYIWIPAGGTRDPATLRTVNEKLHYFRMRGRELFKVAVVKMQSLIDDALAATGLAASDLALVIPHQSNLRIIESVRARLELPREKVAINIDKYGNTSAASIGLALDDARRQGRVREGDLVLMVAFGAGLTWGTILARL